MVKPTDFRILLVFGTCADACPGDALLLETGAVESAHRDVAAEGQDQSPREWFQPDNDRAHVAGCTCCTRRTTAATALARLILDRGRGSRAFFTRIVAVTRTESGRNAIRHALATDPIATAYLRANADP